MVEYQKIIGQKNTQIKKLMREKDILLRTVQNILEMIKGGGGDRLGSSERDDLEQSLRSKQHNYELYKTKFRKTMRELNHDMEDIYRSRSPPIQVFDYEPRDYQINLYER